MSDIRLDPTTGDALLENGDLVLISGGADEVSQLVTQRLRLFLREWFLDTETGVPYYDEILGKGKDIAVIDGVLKQTVLDTPGVLGLEDFVLDYVPETRTLTVELKGRSVEGDFSVEVTI